MVTTETPHNTESPLSALVHTEFQSAVCQAVVFTPDKDFSSSRVMSGFFPEWSNLLGGEPVVLPDADGLPGEVPRIMLRSAPEEWSVEISPARFSLTWRRSAEAQPGFGQQDFFDRVVPILLSYRDVMNARLARVSGLVTRFRPHPQPGLALARHFCKERWDAAPLNRPESFELHAHKRFQLPGSFMVNSWARSKTGTMRSPVETQPVVLCEQDINTLAEEVEGRTLTGDDLTQYFSAVSLELDVILALYFPES